MSPDAAAVLQRCRTCLRTLELPEPFSVGALCSTVERKRGRPLKLLPLTSNEGPFGLLVASARADYIFFAQDTTPVHQRHIVVHELCHVLFGHRSPVVGENELLQLLLPDLQPTLVDSLLRRHSYAAVEEQEAELLASLIIAQADSSTSSVPPPSDIESASLLARLEATLRESCGQVE